MSRSRLQVPNFHELSVIHAEMGSGDAAAIESFLIPICSQN